MAIHTILHILIMHDPIVLISFIYAREAMTVDTVQWSTHRVLQVVVEVFSVDELRHLWFCQVDLDPVWSHRCRGFRLVRGCHFDTYEVAVVQMEVMADHWVHGRVDILRCINDAFFTVTAWNVIYNTTIWSPTLFREFAHRRHHSHVPCLPPVSALCTTYPRVIITISFVLARYA